MAREYKPKKAKGSTGGLPYSDELMVERRYERTPKSNRGNREYAGNSKSYKGPVTGSQ